MAVFNGAYVNQITKVMNSLIGYNANLVQDGIIPNAQIKMLKKKDVEAVKTKTYT